MCSFYVSHNTKICDKIFGENRMRDLIFHRGVDDPESTSEHEDMKEKQININKTDARFNKTFNEQQFLG